MTLSIGNTAVHNNLYDPTRKITEAPSAEGAGTSAPQHCSETSSAQRSADVINVTLNPNGTGYGQSSSYNGLGCASNTGAGASGPALLGGAVGFVLGNVPGAIIGAGIGAAMGGYGSYSSTGECQGGPTPDVTWQAYGAPGTTTNTTTSTQGGVTTVTEVEN